MLCQTSDSLRECRNAIHDLLARQTFLATSVRMLHGVVNLPAHLLERARERPLPPLQSAAAVFPIISHTAHPSALSPPDQRALSGAVVRTAGRARRLPCDARRSPGEFHPRLPPPAFTRCGGLVARRRADVCGRSTVLGLEIPAVFVAVPGGGVGACALCGGEVMLVMASVSRRVVSLVGYGLSWCCDAFW